MKARANQCIYWPGITTSIKTCRLNCKTCGIIAPSHQAEPIEITQFPEWPFQLMCTDFFFLNTHSYLITAGRYSGWISIYFFRPGEATSIALENIFRQLFTDMVCLMSLAQMVDLSSRQIISKHSWKTGVSNRISSVEYPQSNGRAEVGVKTAKRIILNNTASNGSLYNDKAAQAILQYRNTPLQDSNLQLRSYSTDN